MRNTLFIIIYGYWFMGCSKITIANQANNNALKQLPCEEDAKPKSLQLLEQRYRCQSQK